MLNLNETFRETNEKRELEGLEPLTVEDFIVEISVDMCQWLERHPEAVR